MNNSINYSDLMKSAMYSIVRKVLVETAETGLPGDHHFFITFNTSYLGVELSDRLRNKYPEEMTIVIQHWFENLEVTKDYFRIGLNFSNQTEVMKIPFKSLKIFVDPSVDFGLHFDQIGDLNSQADKEDLPNVQTEFDSKSNKIEETNNDVIRLDNFRK